MNGLLDAPLAGQKNDRRRFGPSLPAGQNRARSLRFRFWMKNGAPFESYYRSIQGKNCNTCLTFRSQSPCDTVTLLRAAALQLLGSMADGPAGRSGLLRLYPHYAMSSYETALLYVRKRNTKNQGRA